jgi:hypothetical protein
MNQNPEQGGRRMETRIAPPVNTEQGCPGRHGTPGIDIAGILMGVPILLIGLALLAVNGANVARGMPYDPIWVFCFPWAGILLLMSVALFIPGALYTRATTRALGFAAAALATAVAGLLALEAGACAWAFFDPHEELRSLALYLGAIVLAVLTYAAGCAAVLFKKLQPRGTSPAPGPGTRSS